MKVFSRLKNHREAGSSNGVPAEMSLLEHLEELRARLIKVALAFGAACVVAWFVYDPLLAALTRPLKSLPAAEEFTRGRLITMAPTEAFFVRLKITAFSGFFLALPVILWQLWRFVTPGLYSHEKRYVVPFVLVSMGLFAAGIWLAYVTLPQALKVLAAFAGSELVLIPRASEYLSFLMLLMMAFGFSFEFPVVLLGLVMAGVLTSDSLHRGRRMAWVIIVVAAAVITPTTDPITMLLLAIPMALLYEGTVLGARMLKK